MTDDVELELGPDELVNEWPDAAPLTFAARAGEPLVDEREAWGALPPKSLPGGFSSLEYTVAHYTAGARGYLTTNGNHERCREQTRSIQRQHQAIPEQSDIEYNALVCGCGRALVGRQRGQRGGANGNAESNRTAPSICFLAGVGDVPPPAMFAAAAWVHAQVEARAGRALTMRGHRDVFATSCPGDPIYEWVLAGGYRTDQPTPTPPPEDDDMAPDIVQLTDPWGPLVTGSVIVADPGHQTYRHVVDEDELSQLRATFARRGWVFPDPIPPIPGAWCKQYGVLIGE